MRSTRSLALALAAGTLLSGSAALAHPASHHARAPRTAQAQAQASGFDTRGWTMLGEKRVDGRTDSDTINVGRREGRFTKLAVVVEDSDADLSEMTIFFGNGLRYSPDLRQTFRDGSRSRTIDLPGEARYINRITFRYGNVPGGRRARVQVWAKEENTAPVAKPSGFDARGWTFLGEKNVDGWQDQDRIKVKPQFGHFNKLALVVEDSDIEMLELSAGYGKGLRFAPDVHQTFKDGARIKVVDLPPEASALRMIDLRYRNLPGDARAARVQVWAKDDTIKPAPTDPAWNPNGWIALGAVNVDPSRGEQYFEGILGFDRFSKLTLEAVRGDFDVTGVVVTMANGTRTNIRTSHHFQDGSRTASFKVPSDQPIKAITVRYGAQRGGGKGALQLHGWPARAPAPPPPPPPAPSPVSVQATLDINALTYAGAVSLDGRRASDVVTGHLGKDRYRKLGIVVEGGELDLDSFVITFANGSTFAPSFRHHFRNGAAALVVELPSNQPEVRSIELRYGANKGDGRVRLNLYGIK